MRLSRPMATWATASIHSRGVSPRLTPRSNSSTSGGISANSGSSASSRSSRRASFGVAQIDDDAGALGRLDARLVHRLLQRRGRLTPVCRRVGFVPSAPHALPSPCAHDTPTARPAESAQMAEHFFAYLFRNFFRYLAQADARRGNYGRFAGESAGQRARSCRRDAWRQAARARRPRLVRETRGDDRRAILASFEASARLAHSSS